MQNEIKILIVEDDEILAFLQQELLMANGIKEEALIFPNGKEALDFMSNEAEKKQKYLVLLDINMPVMDGWIFLDELEKTSLLPDTKVIIVTSSINGVDREKAKDYKVVEHYITKPLTDCDLVTATLELLKKE